MGLIRDDYRYFAIGLVLVAAVAACNDLATVPYSAMLRQLSTPQTSGQVSGFGIGAGYFGSVVLLLVVFGLFLNGDGGLLGVSTDDGFDFRAAMVFTAVWFALLALPVLVVVPSPKPELLQKSAYPGFFGGYRKLWAEIRGEWRRDPNVIYYLIASAVFRDGLTGVFQFGTVLGITVYGIAEDDVMLFGVSASIIAAIGAVIGGVLDDRFGAKPVIVGALTAMIVVGLILMTLSGVLAFWICGLLLCLFIGPSLSAARTLMLRISAEGKEGVAFGLYTTTGRAVSFLAPVMFSTFIAIFGADRAGIGGLLVVLLAGLLGMLAVKTPPRVGLLPSPFPCRWSGRRRVRCSTVAPLTVIEQFTSRPTLMMLMLAEASAGSANWTSLLHGRITLNSVCSNPPLSTYVMLMARPSPLTS